MNPFTRLQSSPSLKLTGNRRGVTSRTDSVNTTLAVVGDMAVDGRLHLEECVADEFLKVSDARLKKNVKQLDTQTSERIVRNLAPVSFTYTGTNKDSIGYIAQQTETIDSSLVHINKDNVYSMKYGDVSVHTSNVVRSLLERVHELEKNQRI